VQQDRHPFLDRGKLGWRRLTIWLSQNLYTPISTFMEMTPQEVLLWRDEAVDLMKAKRK